MIPRDGNWQRQPPCASRIKRRRVLEGRRDTACEDEVWNHVSSAKGMNRPQWGTQTLLPKCRREENTSFVLKQFCTPRDCEKWSNRVEMTKYRVSEKKGKKIGGRKEERMGSVEVGCQEVDFSVYQLQKGKFLHWQVRGTALDAAKSPRITIDRDMPNPYRLWRTGSFV